MTPYGPTKEFSLKDIIKQGTCNGLGLCSTSAGQYCTDIYSKVFIGIQKVKRTAAFVDDLIDPNRTVSDIIESNENAKHFEKIKRLTFKADKCKSLYINHGKEQGWTGMYTLVVPSLSTKFIKNSHQNLPV